MKAKSKNKVQNEQIDTAYPDIPFIGKLLTNTNISSSVYYAYYSMIPKVEKGKVPFSYCVYGAYPPTIEWEFLQYRIQHKDHPFDKATTEQIDNALRNYAEGFKEGYYNFEQDKITNRLFTNDAIKTQIIFDEATSWLLTERGFSTTFGEGTNFFDQWRQAGKATGYYYRAWYLILENHSLFSPLFQRAPREFTITYSSENYIAFQGEKYYFPFDCYQVSTNLSLLVEELYKPDVTILSIQRFPDLIFDEKFNGHFDLAASISNIIEIMAEDAKRVAHIGDTYRVHLIDWFISECEKRAVKYIVENDKSVDAPDTMAKKMVGINEAQKTKQTIREKQRQQAFKRLVAGNYSPNTADFREKAKIESLDRVNPAHYLKFLRGEKEKYTNAIAYYNAYGNSEAETILQNAYTDILTFVNAEIAARIGNVIVVNEPEPKANPNSNDYILSTINEYLEPFKSKIKDTDYDKLAGNLKRYFETGNFFKIGVIPVGRVNMKALGWALNNIYRGLKQGNLSVDYLRFARNNISTFSKVDFDESNYTKSKLYKYFTTKTQ